MSRAAALALVLVLVPGALTAWAGQADVLFVDVRREPDGGLVFAVTVRHDDRDPDHWADWWRVRTPDGQELGRRVLLHSHVGEQPFTREERVEIPPGVRRVVVEAHDQLHGLGGATVAVDLTRPEGARYRIRADGPRRSLSPRSASAERSPGASARRRRPCPRSDRARPR